MPKSFWAIAVIAALFGGGVALAQTQDKGPELKKEDPVPAATAPNKSEQSGTQEPASKTPGTAGNPAAFADGTLTAPGALVDVDTAPSKFSSRTAADDQLPTAGYRLKHLNSEQKSSIYGELRKGATTGASSRDAQAVVGAQVPTDLILNGLQSLPETINTKFPELKGLAFATLGGKPVLVDPRMRIVVDVAAQ